MQFFCNLSKTFEGDSIPIQVKFLQKDNLIVRSKRLQELGKFECEVLLQPVVCESNLLRLREVVLNAFKQLQSSSVRDVITIELERIHKEWTVELVDDTTDFINAFIRNFVLRQIEQLKLFAAAPIRKEKLTPEVWHAAVFQRNSVKPSSFAEEVSYVVVGVRPKLISIQKKVPQVDVDTLVAEVELEKFDIVV